MTYPSLTIGHVQNVRTIDGPGRRTLVIECAGMSTVLIHLSTERGDEALMTPLERAARENTAAPTPNPEDASSSYEAFPVDPTPRLGRPAGSPAPRSGRLPLFLSRCQR